MLLGIFSTSCSVTRNKGKRNLEISKDLLSENILESIKKQNITNSSFFIQKAEIEIVTQNGKQKLIGNIKFENPDKYLISIKSRTGIEAARIYISNDTILVNDRINKKLYSGSSVSLKRKYGFTTSFLPLIFGDILLNEKAEEIKEKCYDEKLNIDYLVRGVLFNYVIDCKKRKITFVNQLNNFVQKGIEIKYENFKNSGNILIPTVIELEDSQFNTIIKIKMIKIDIPWDGRIEFVPGKGYELIELL